MITGKQKIIPKLVYECIVIPQTSIWKYSYKISMKINVTHVNRYLILLNWFILTIVHTDFLINMEGQ